MLRKARDEGTVCHVTTLWDSFFEGGRDHRMERCSATLIPYLDGDYWPGEAENLLMSIGDTARQAGKGKGGVVVRKSATKGKRYGGGAATTDEQLMTRLGEILGKHCGRLQTRAVAVGCCIVEHVSAMWLQH